MIPALLLLLFVDASVSFFYLSGPWGSATSVSQVFLVLFAYLLLMAGEIWIYSFLVGKKDLEKNTREVLVTHLPWVLGWFSPVMLHITLPDPHNLPERKMEVLFGVIFVTHLFLFCRLMISKSYQKGQRHSKVFGVVAAFLFMAVTAWTANVCEPSGDEPHYLLMAYSLIHDGDLDLTNNYSNRDYEHFYHRGDLQPQALEHVVNGKRYSHHPLGPVLLILPGFALLGRMGAAMTMALLAALTLFLTLWTLEESGAKGWPVHAVGIVGLFSSPFLLFSGLVFPEIPTAFLVALGLYLYLKKRWGWLGLDLGLMLWMHNRNAILILPFLVLVLLEMKKAKKTRDVSAGKFALGFGIPLVLLAFYFYVLYGVLTPLGAHNEPFTSLFRLDHFVNGFFGLLFDQECGLWFHFPIFALMVAGGILLWRSKNPLRYLVIGVFGFYYLFMSFYENLGLTPATRYMVGVTPLLLFLIHPVIERLDKKGPWRVLTGLLLLVGVLVNWLLAAVPWMRYNKLEGENWILKIAGSVLHLPLTSLEPAFNLTAVEWKSYLISFFWLGLTLWLSFLFLKDSSRRSRR